MPGGDGGRGGNNMSRHHWKNREREAAAMVAGRRYPANMGGPIDVEGPVFVAQVKERKRLSLLEIETLALEIERQGQLKTKAGIVMVKRSGGRGTETPWLICMTAATFRLINGPLPTDPAPEAS